MPEKFEPPHLESRNLSTQQIGRLGELLVQYKLLCKGIDSAPMTTDAGIDLVAYLPDPQRSFTIQVKTNLAPKPGGGKGALALDWWVSEDCPAQFFALADISKQRVWLMSKSDLASMAQQRSNGRWHLYMYTESDPASSAYERNGDNRFTSFLFETAFERLFVGASIHQTI
jgi:hypothetical protein